MCRMFAVRATHATIVANELAAAEHSLRYQSQCDLIHRDHSDGWGDTKLANTHPFAFGLWTFTHNGIFTALDALRDGMLRKIPARLRDNTQGQTDSELMFYWLLRRLEIDKAIEGNRCLSLNKMREILATEILELDRRNLAAEAMRRSDEQAKLNVFLTNGSVFVGTRFRNTLFMLEHQAARPTGKPLQSIAVASEPPDF